MLHILGLSYFRNRPKTYWLAWSLLIFPGTVLNAESSIFDIHSHYKTEDAAQFAPDDVIQIMDENKISHMVIIGEPPERALALSQKAAGRIIPWLGLYQTHDDKARWMHDPLLPGRLEKQLQRGAYKGIGEIHIFAKDKENTNYKKILQLAYEHGLPVLLHGDRAVVKQAFNWFPGLVIIWAHLGEDPDTVMLEQMLMQYPSLYIDTSIRDVLIVKEGKLLEDWKHLFIKYPDRFMVAIDTYYTPRWDKMSDVTRFIRTWLKDLPNEVARKMAFDNAARLFLKH